MLKIKGEIFKYEKNKNTQKISRDYFESGDGGEFVCNGSPDDGERRVYAGGCV